MSKNIKLKLNVSSGEISLQCSEDMFDKAMKECRKVLKSYSSISKVETTQSSPTSSKSKPTSKKATGKTRGSNASNTSPKPKKTSKGYTPKLDTSLNLVNLPAFYDKYKPANHAEKILIFAMFLKDQLSISTSNLDQVYSCYLRVKDKTKAPKAFLQAFRDAASSDYGYIEFSLNDGITVPIHGSNHFEHDLKRSDTDE